MSKSKFIQPPNTPQMGPRPQQQQQQQSINVNPQDLEDLVCECGNYTFVNAVVLKKLPAVVSPSGQPQLVPSNVVVCYACGRVPEMIATQLAKGWFRPEKTDQANEDGIISTNLPDLQKVEIPEVESE